MTTNDEERVVPQDFSKVALEPVEQVTFGLLVKVAARLESGLNRVLKPFDLTSSTYGILKILQQAGATGRSCGDISEQLIADVPDMTRLLDRLERLGYIARERSSIDRRMVNVTITDKGLAALENLREGVRDCHIRQLGHLGKTKLEELTMLLNIILGQMHTKGKAGEIHDLPPVKHAPH